MLRSQNLLRLLTVSLVLVYLAIGAILYNQYRNLTEVLARANINEMWSIVQMSVEHERLANALDAYVHAPSDATAEPMRLRYEVYVSRVGIMESGTPQVMMQGKPVYTEALAALHGLVADGDRCLQKPDAPPHPWACVQGIRDQLVNLRPTVREVVNAALQTSATLADERNAAVRLQTLQTTGLTVFQCLLTFLLAAAMAQQFRKRELARAQVLQAQAEMLGALQRNEEALEARVRERTAALEQANDALRERESALRAATARAEEASQMKSNFLANMSHEIRTPLNAVIGLSHLMLGTTLSARQRDYAEKTQRSGQHLLGLINDILDLSKVEAGKLGVEVVDFELQAVLDSVSDLVGPKAAAKDLRLQISVDPEMPRRLRGDPLRLGQILINYVSNAVKFTERGEILVTVRQELLDDAGVLAHFAVRDTGIGISADQQAQLFESFQQADASITRKYGGTGLGLAISRHLAELMGGQVGVDSAPGQGSTFWFTARLGIASPAGALGAAAPVAGTTRGRRILVVNDDAEARAALAAMLTGMEFAVTPSPLGDAARALAQAAESAGHPFEVAFVDWQVPGTKAAETARALAALPRAPRVVVVTPRKPDDPAPAAPQPGTARPVLRKPFTPSTLFETVMHALRLADAAQEAAAAPSASTPRAPAGTGQEALRNARVLLVDDDALNRQVGQELLARMGIRVDLAEDGAQALARLEAGRYDLVLMDMQMPVMDGLAATRRIRERTPGDALPVLAMTANARAEDRARCLEAGMNDHIVKPIDPQELATVLLRWLAPVARLTAVGERDTA